MALSRRTAPQLLNKLTISLNLSVTHNLPEKVEAASVEEALKPAKRKCSPCPPSPRIYATLTHPLALLQI